MKVTNEDILKNEKVVEMWKNFKPKVLTKEELDELRIPAYSASF
jgi:hypothetical protein